MSSPQPFLRTRRPIAISLRLALVALALAAPATAGDWSFTVTPYAWATDVGADVEIDDREVADVEIGIEDLVDKVDVTAQLRFEARHGRHGLAADLFFVGLEGDGREIALPAVPVPASVDGELGLTVLDAAGTFNPRGDGQGFTLVYGARLLDRDFTVDASLPVAPGVSIAREYEVSESLVDALVGARFAGRGGARFSYELRANVSSGGSELSWDGFAAVGYTLDAAGRYTLLAGYRHLDVEFEKDDATPGAVEAEVTLSGFVAGLKFTF
jgi:hypothetical protein